MQPTRFQRPRSGSPKLSSEIGSEEGVLSHLHPGIRGPPRQTGIDAEGQAKVRRPAVFAALLALDPRPLLSWGRGACGTPVAHRRDSRPLRKERRRAEDDPPLVLIIFSWLPDSCTFGLVGLRGLSTVIAILFFLSAPVIWESRHHGRRWFGLRAAGGTRRAVPNSPDESAAWGCCRGWGSFLRGWAVQYPTVLPPPRWNLRRHV